MKTLQSIIDMMEAQEPATKEEIALAIRCEEIRCAAVDAFYKEMGVDRTPEAILTRQVYRKTSNLKADRGLAYS
jgi:hypothetical protein